MKIKYEFANETVEIEVDEQWGSVLIDLDRQEYNNNQTETRRHCSLDAINLDENWLPSDENTELSVLQHLDNQRLYAAIAQLNPRQQSLICRVYFEGLSFADIARAEGRDASGIAKATARAVKKLKKFL